jgi:hypothetical protein
MKEMCNPMRSNRDLGVTMNDSYIPLGELPQGWVEGTHPSTKDVYYYNQQTRESQWTHPSLPTDLPAQWKAGVQDGKIDLLSKLN